MVALGKIAAVENGGAQQCLLVNSEERSVRSDHPEIHQETQECVATWNFGRKFVAKL